MSGISAPCRALPELPYTHQMRLLALLLASTMGCYAPSFDTCALTCASGESCPSGYTCSAGRCAAGGTSCDGDPGRDARAVDAADDAASDAAAPLDFTRATWPTASRVAGVSDATGCERSPALNADGTILLFARSLTVTCTDTGKIVRAAVAPDGTVSAVSLLNIFAQPDAALFLPMAIIPGSALGSPSAASLVYAERVTAMAPMLRRVKTNAQLTITGQIDTLTIPGSPSFTPDGKDVIYDDRAVDPDTNLWETVGTYPGPYTVDGELISTSTSSPEGSPAVSPDGRVVIFTRVEAMGADLWIAKRSAIGEEFGPPVRMGASINSMAAEIEPFIAANGDLYFASARDSGTYRLFRAPAVFDQ